MSIALFLDPPDELRDLALQIAFAIADHTAAESVELLLAADAAACLEIGISRLGATAMPPIILIPPFVHEDSRYIGALYNGDGGDDRRGYGSLWDLVDDTGVFRLTGGREFVSSNQAAFALSERIFKFEPTTLIGLAPPGSFFWKAIQPYFGRARRARLMTLDIPELAAPSDLDVIRIATDRDLPRDITEPEDFDFFKTIRDARRTAATIANLIDALATEERPLLRTAE